MFQCEDIIAAVSVAFDADANMAALVPGGLWHRRAPSSPAQGLDRPYAVLTLTPEDKEFLSDKTCIQSFTVTITVYGDEKTDNTGVIAGFLTEWDMDRTLFASVPAQVVGFFPSGEAIDLDPEEKEGHDVVVASKRWTLVLHH